MKRVIVIASADVGGDIDREPLGLQTVAEAGRQAFLVLDHQTRIARLPPLTEMFAAVP